MNTYVAELVGTAVLIYFGCGVNATVSLNKSYAQGAGWIVIAFGWGIAVTLGIYAVGTISGAHINPAVTFGLAMAGKFPWSDVPGYIAFQVLGAIVGATLVWLQYLPHWGKTEEPETKLGVFSTGPAIPSTFSNLLSEILGAAILVFAIMFIGANTFTEGLNPLVVGGLVFAIGVSMGGSTGYAINPARDLGPRIAHFLLPIMGKGGSNWKYSWIPVAGPLLGGAFGALLYNCLFKEGSSLYFWITLVAILLVILAAIREQKTQKSHD
ncbi:MIP/aquaporin family protein [Reichenbachiella sp. MALMAid0571]|uniref:MIP/aquaporin family protein n=1 Tax=Reichenbachiella sp. MALMAid0571 TaxID=3143939 RepID=UPI0032DE4662